MKRTLYFRLGFSGVLVAAFLTAFGVLALEGCGTQTSTSPVPAAISASSNDDGVGELPLPPPRKGIPAPVGVSARPMGGWSVLVTWNAPAVNYVAIVSESGAELGRVDASTGEFVVAKGHPGKACLYTVQYASADRVGPEGSFSLTLPDPGQDTSWGSNSAFGAN